MWYIETVKVAFRRKLTYRSAAIAGLLTNFAFGLLRAYVFKAVATANGGQLAGYSIHQLNTFAMSTQVLLSCMAVWSHVDLPASVLSGQFATDYCKPTDLFRFYQARETGKSIHDLILRGLPLVIGYGLLLELVWPDSLLRWTFFWVSLVLGWSVSYSWRLLVGTLSFWTLDVRGPGAILFTIAMLLMGFLIPMPVTPHWMQDLARWTPFPSILQAPLDIYMGRTALGDCIPIFVTQAAWGFGTAMLSRILLSQGQRRMVVQGG